MNGISDRDVSIGEDVGPKSTTMNQWAQYALCGESLQVSARLTETLSKALDVSNSESPTDQAVEINAPGDEIPASFAVLEATTIRQHELIKDLGLDKRQIVASPATSRWRESAYTCFISITHQASAGNCLRLGNENDRFRRPSGQCNRLDPTTLRRVARGSG